MRGKALGAIVAAIFVVLAALALFKLLAALMGMVIFAVVVVGVLLLATRLLRHSARR